MSLIGLFCLVLGIALGYLAYPPADASDDDDDDDPPCDGAEAWWW